MGSPEDNRCGRGGKEQKTLGQGPVQDEQEDVAREDVGMVTVQHSRIIWWDYAWRSRNGHVLDRKWRAGTALKRGSSIAFALIVNRRWRVMRMP